MSKPTDMELKDAYERGKRDYAPRDVTIFNPYNPDEEPELYDAWEKGGDAADKAVVIPWAGLGY